MRDARLCRKCHNNSLDIIYMELIETFVDEEHGILEVYLCEECNKKDIYIIDEDRWLGDYLYLRDDVLLRNGFHIDEFE